ncbi:collagen alpha-1(I) chain-like isoform X2 [Haliaeetus albicilla]|uniref:collagen alpha-1(I) chain-like isoform X2 n=1 Tax=Haliaeetus albicilla TaxID=8969 RepID=UPI0037E8499C
MWRWEQPPAGSGSPVCPDLLRHVDGPRSPLSPLYLSFFEEECRTIATRLRLGAAVAAEPSPGPGEDSALWPDAAGPITSTPLHTSPPLDERAPDSATPAARPSTGGSEAAAPGPARGVPRRLPQPAAGGGPGAARPGSGLARPQALSRKGARRGAGQPPCGGPGPAGRPRTPARSPGRGGRLSVSRARASLGLQLPKAGKELGGLGTRLPQPSGTKLKLMPAAKSRLQHPHGALQLTQPSAIPKPTPRDAEMETAVKVGGRRQPSRRLSTAIPIVASRSRLQPLGKVASPKRFCLGSTTQELICNRTRELKEDGESKEWLVAAGTVLGVGKADQTWVCVESSFSSELAPGPTPGCGNAVPAEQSAGDQLSQELKHVKNELERVKGELADKTAQCEAYCQMISSLQAQLRAAGICLEDAAVESGDSGRH